MTKMMSYHKSGTLHAKIIHFISLLSFYGKGSNKYFKNLLHLTTVQLQVKEVTGAI